MELSFSAMAQDRQSGEIGRDVDRRRSARPLTNTLKGSRSQVDEEGESDSLDDPSPRPRVRSRDRLSLPRFCCEQNKAHVHVCVRLHGLPPPPARGLTRRRREKRRETRFYKGQLAQVRRMSPGDVA